MEYSGALSAFAGAPVYLKCENLQTGGSFKIRGAYTRMARLTAEEKAAGVIAASAGNHAQGVALAARMLGISATVYMPVDAALPKAAATAGYGAEIHRFGTTVDEALAEARAEAARTGKVIKIGRASCRERGGKQGGGERREKERSGGCGQPPR